MIKKNIYRTDMEKINNSLMTCVLLLFVVNWGRIKKGIKLFGRYYFNDRMWVEEGKKKINNWPNETRNKIIKIIYIV